MAQDFPGNVRQLENLCHWLTVMTPSRQTEIADLPPEWRETQATALSDNWRTALAQQVTLALQRGALHQKRNSTVQCPLVIAPTLAKSRSVI